MKKIKSINISRSETYDLNVRNNHNYICNGTVLHNCDYRGEIKIILVNLGIKKFFVERGMRVAQMIVKPVWIADLEYVDTLDETIRGEGGYGSTGK